MFKKELNIAYRKSFRKIRGELFDEVRKNVSKPFPSKPYTSWARRTGNADKHLIWNQKRNEAYFGNTVDYVYYLEKGSSKMKPRPAMSIALDNKHKRIQNIIAQNILQQLDGKEIIC